MPHTKSLMLFTRTTVFNTSHVFEKNRHNRHGFLEAQTKSRRNSLVAGSPSIYALLMHRHGEAPKLGRILRLLQPYCTMEVKSYARRYSCRCGKRTRTLECPAPLKMSLEKDHLCLNHQQQRDHPIGKPSLPRPQWKQDVSRRSEKKWCCTFIVIV